MEEKVFLCEMNAVMFHSEGSEVTEKCAIFSLEKKSSC